MIELWISLAFLYLTYAFYLNQKLDKDEENEYDQIKGTIVDPEREPEAMFMQTQPSPELNDELLPKS